MALLYFNYDIHFQDIAFAGPLDSITVASIIKLNIIYVSLTLAINR
jgi:hypothetical protein